MKEFLGYLIVGVGLGVFKALEKSWQVGLAIMLIMIGIDLIIDNKIRKVKNSIIEEIDEVKGDELLEE